MVHRPGSRLRCGADFLKRFTDIELVERFFSIKIPQKEFERLIKGKKAYRLPGYPGPYGDQAYYYLVPLGHDRIIEITAHKYYLKTKKDPTSGRYPETGYDKVIEAIIATIEPTADKPLDRPVQQTR